MKLMKLNEKGIAHYLVAAVTVLAVAAVGTYVLTQTHAETPSSVESSQAPANPSILYNSGTTAKNDYIYTATSTGSIANTKLLGQSAIWGPTGSKVFYVNNAQSAVYSAGSGGNGIPNLVTKASANKNEAIADIDWSSSANKLAVSENNGFDSGKPYSLYIMNKGGGGAKNVIATTQNFSNITSLSWSPNGNTLLFEGSLLSSDTTYGIYSMNADGSGLTEVAVMGAIGGGNPWSPNSSQITYSAPSSSNSNVTDLVTANANGSNPKTIASCTTNTSNIDTCFGPSWSPNGQDIAYYLYSGHQNTYTINFVQVSNDSSTSVNTGAMGQPFVWSPDSSEIAVEGVSATSPELEVINVSSLAKTPITTVSNAPPSITNSLAWGTSDTD
ncbi:MAG TPA: hypothetical protein VMR34_03540 [Candidatus Saccharimonadales bacterium]|nr:hypothetical protein [Candidatus Saccharimonadales bacterium]